MISSKIRRELSLASWLIFITINITKTDDLIILALLFAVCKMAAMFPTTVIVYFCNTSLHSEIVKGVI